MSNQIKPKVLITFKIDGKNGGPYISHSRIISNEYLKSRYYFEKLWIPRIRHLFNPFCFFKVVKRIKKAKPAFVHIAGLQLDGFFSMLICRFANVKTVLAIHGSTSEAIEIGRFKKRLISKLEKYTIRKASIVYGVSDYVSSWDVCKYAKRYFGTIYNFTKESDSFHSCANIREELGISKEDIVVSSTGRITKEKGFDTLCSVARSFKNQSNVKFIIAGNGSYYDVFKKEVQKDNMDNQVFLLGYRSDICDILKSSDIFIICTKHETLCISVLEAAMEGLPLIVSNVGGLPEIVDESCGYLINPLDENGFINAIEELVGFENKRRMMGSRALEKVKEKFSSVVIEKQLDELYCETLSI